MKASVGLKTANCLPPMVLLLERPELGSGDSAGIPEWLAGVAWDPVWCLSIEGESVAGSAM